MDIQTPEIVAHSFARRWLSHESDAMREMFERELAKVLRTTPKNEAEPSPR
jgi:hypothetical protein